MGWEKTSGERGLEGGVGCEGEWIKLKKGDLAQRALNCRPDLGAQAGQFYCEIEPWEEGTLEWGCHLGSELAVWFRTNA